MRVDSFRGVRQHAEALCALERDERPDSLAREDLGRANDRFELDGTSYLILTTVVDDPQYLNDTFITSEQFKLEPDAAKWNPAPCKAR